MVRDGVANIVQALRERGFDPRRVGADSWESRCPVHRGTDHDLSISRDESDHVVLECRSSQHCLFEQIIRAVRLGYDTLYDETPDWVMRQLSDMPIQRPGSIAEIVIGPAAPADAEDFVCSLLAPFHSDPRSIIHRSTIHPSELDNV